MKNFSKKVAWPVFAAVVSLLLYGGWYLYVQLEYAAERQQVISLLTDVPPNVAEHILAEIQKEAQGNLSKITISVGDQNEHAFVVNYDAVNILDRESLIGNAPFIVDKETGDVYRFGTYISGKQQLEAVTKFKQGKDTFVTLEDRVIIGVDNEIDMSDYTYVVLPPAAELSDEQVEKIFSLLTIAHREFNTSTTRMYPAAKPLEEYVYQIGPENSGQYGEDEVVIIKGLPVDYMNEPQWESEHIIVFDGGADFLWITVNLTTNEVLSFTTHGDA